MPEPKRSGMDSATLAWRVIALGFALFAAVAAAGLMADAVLVRGFTVWDVVRVGLIFVTTLWLAWGAAQAVVGLWPARRMARDLPLPTARTVILLPICNEDPVAAAARLEAMEASCRTAGLSVDFAVLSDTRDPQAQAREYATFLPLLREVPGRLRVYYRNRTDNHGRKAGNIEEFIRRAGAAWEFAVILDADSLMEGETIARMISRMMADPQLGLLQTLPKIVGGSSLFGRAMMFAASFHSPVFARGLRRMQGETGPFWGHNAIVRIRAMAQSCGLPQLSGRPPFGGTILSHDYVEAALLARADWRVEVDPTLEGSYEEGPDNIIAYARRDRRWCQGNLQHSRLLFAPGLRMWSRFVFLQGIAAYLVSSLWAAFMVASVLATLTEPAPDYFPEPYQLFPVFPDDRTREIVALAIGIGGLLLLPKLAILLSAIAERRTPGFGGALRATVGVLAEVLLSSLISPVMLAYQVRAVFQVVTGQDGGWPANQRGEGRLTLPEGFAAGAWIALWGLAVLLSAQWLAPDLTLWLLPVALPMIAAPLLIWASSLPLLRGLFMTPEDADPTPVLSHYRALQSRADTLTESQSDAPAQAV